MTAFIPEPHILLIVVAGTSSGKPASEGGLPGGCLAESCRHHAAKNHFVDPAAGETRIDERSSCGDAAELSRLHG